MLFELEIVPAAGVPATLVDAAVARYRRGLRRRSSSFEARDQVWAVFDHDQHPEVLASIRRAKASGVQVAYSNPCFELWALIHFVEHNAPDDRTTVQKHLAKLMPNYDPEKGKIFDYQLLKASYESACQRAERMAANREAEGTPEGNPFTGVFRLTRTIAENGKA